MDRSKYPQNWREIRDRIIDRADHRCECRGECGDEHPQDFDQRCNAPDGEVVIRDPRVPAFWRRPCTESAALAAGEWDRSWGKDVKIVLTVAHLDHDPSNSDPENLRAMCQRCHNLYDLPHRRRNALQTRRSHKAAGELVE
jgi:5-methylcytosine-specific restriction endonuclease McrA